MEEVSESYEENTGKVIIETFDGIDPMAVPLQSSILASYTFSFNSDNIMTINHPFLKLKFTSIEPFGNPRNQIGAIPYVNAEIENAVDEAGNFVPVALTIISCLSKNTILLIPSQSDFLSALAYSL